MSVDTSPEAQFAKAIAAFGPITSPVILAVSGGSDSTALMHLAAQKFHADQLYVVSVDHGLRPEAKDEISQVAQQAAKLGLHHQIANWHWDGQGNLQASARSGRWTALADAAWARGANWILTGHTQDDQVETLLMRLARGSGVDGLTGMARQTSRDGLHLGRPLLEVSRAGLLDWLMANGIGWSDDPSNDDPRFDRVRARQMAEQLQSLGLTEKRVLQTIDHMRAAQTTLQEAAASFAGTQVVQDQGDLILSHDVLRLDRSDTPRRVFAAALRWVANRDYRPRFEQLLSVAEQALDGQTVTLGGVILTAEADGRTRLSRESAATLPTVCDDDGPSIQWDGRWRLNGPFTAGMTVKALGEGIRECQSWRDVGLPRHSLLASPSVWRDDALVAAPLAGLSNGWSARIVADFHSTAFAIED